MTQLALVEGPAGSGKSQLVSKMLADGRADVQADYTSLWVAMRGVERDSTGRYPIRTAADPVVETNLGSYVRRTVVRQGLRSDLNVVVTSGTPDTAPEWQLIADELGVDFELLTVDPGEEVVIERLLALSDTGDLPPECSAAIRRWYG